MKRNYKALSILLLSLVVFIQLGCAKEGFQFEKGNVCYVAADGKQQCVPLDATHFVLMEKSGGAITLTARDAKGLMEPQVLQGRGEIGVLQELLEENRQLMTFDPRSIRLDWKNDALLLVDLKSGLVKSTLSTKGVKGIVLMHDADGTISFAFYGGADCPRPIDIDMEMERHLDKTGSFSNLDLNVCDGALLGRFEQIVDGPIIVVIDPAIIGDPDARGFKLDHFDPTFRAWELEQPHVANPAVFLELSSRLQDLPLPDGKQSLMGANQDVASAKASSTEDCSKAAATDTLCRMRGTVQIEECLGIVTFSTGATGANLRLDARLCNLRIERNIRTMETTILCDPACRARFGKIICR
jgi:hypothetical protein